MRTLLKNANVYTADGFKHCDISISDGAVHFETAGSFDRIEDLHGLYLIPGFVDVHVHLREPGFSYKETIRTGTMAAAHGGFTAVCAMPNLNPVPSTLEALKEELSAIQKDAIVRVYPYGSITMERDGRGVLSDMEALSPYVAGYSDDGTGVQTEALMKEAMQKAKQLQKKIVAHCEDERELKKGGCIHDGDYAKEHGHIGINSESEWKQLARDLQLLEETGAEYHVCHISTKESVSLIREAKKKGLPVSCETGPHYLIYTDADLREDGSWKMNPPIRAKEDRDALVEGIKDGTIDCIITDHAPHSAEEKAKGLDASAFGIVGLETSFASVYTKLVKPGIISFERMIELMCDNPRKLFGIPGPIGGIKEGDVADLTVLDLSEAWTVNAKEQFYSMGKSTLFDGEKLTGVVKKTYVAGEAVYPFSKEQ